MIKNFLKNIVNKFTPESELDAEFSAIIESSLRDKEIAHAIVKVKGTATYEKQVKLWGLDKKMNFLFYCMKKANDFSAKKHYSWEDHDYHLHIIHNAYVLHFFRNKMGFGEKEFLLILHAVRNFDQRKDQPAHGWPVAYLINNIKKEFSKQTISLEMRKALEALRQLVDHFDNEYFKKEKIKLVDKIDEILFQNSDSASSVRPTYFLGSDDFSDFANEEIKEIKDEVKQAHWFRIIAHVLKTKTGKPTVKYLKESKQLIQTLGADEFKTKVHGWFDFVIKLKEQIKEHTVDYGNGRPYTYRESFFLDSLNSDALKGLVWMCCQFHDIKTVRLVANLAERCYRKIPGKGPAAAGIGNACFYTLFVSKGLDGIGELSRLKLRVKQANAQKTIEKYLLETAEKRGVSIYEIEDMAVSDFGLVDNELVVEFDDYKGVLALTKIGKTTLKWIKPDGNLQKTVPTKVKEKFAAKFKKLKDTKKQLEKTSTGQRDRIDRMFRVDRKISFENFNKFYFEHGLMSFLTNKIIWNFIADEKEEAAIYINGTWVNDKAEIIKPTEDCQVSLWHPALKKVDEVESWRNFLMENEIQQPIKQAFREVYLLTEAELNTKHYSNRMAAHILKQHQFNSLAKIRGWKYALMGSFDDGIYNDFASIEIKDFGLRAEFWVNEVDADGEYNDTGIWNYIATDQLKFVTIEEREDVDLVDVPAVLFSELMRDVDLFVGVASVGNDPAWQDSGGLTQYRDYWHQYSFGNLSEIAKNRKSILEGLVPRLKIRNVAEIKDKFLVVKGKLRTYKIHIGSTNILMEPNDQYLCIVPAAGKKDLTGNLFIPFEGDKGLSIILSKAFLLADDDKITDSSITSQIGR